MRNCCRLLHWLLAVLGLVADALTFLRLGLRSRSALAAENLFLRKQLALYLERKAKPPRATNVARVTLVLLSGLFDWKGALSIVKPETFIKWHRQGFRLFWRWKSKPRGRPRTPEDLRRLIVEAAKDNPTWGEEMKRRKKRCLLAVVLCWTLWGVTATHV